MNDLQGDMRVERFSSWQLVPGVVVDPESREAARENWRSEVYIWAKVLREQLMHAAEERCVMLMIGSTLREVALGVGTRDRCVVNLKAIAKCAAAGSYFGIALLHNHPSGDLQPSNDDIGLTRRVAQLCDILGIKLLDHFIVSSSGTLSFFDKGLI